jgi:hypothetical protein
VQILSVPTNRLYRHLKKPNIFFTKIKMTFQTLFTILLITVCLRQIDSASISDASYDYYDDYTADQLTAQTSCSCQNGGACVLDFCVCLPGFTGRHCEINLSSPQAKLGCGRLINGETEFLECARCKCTDQFLTCTALATLTCDRFRASEASKLKGDNLNGLVELMHDIETDAYSFYIKEYLAGKEYRVSVKNVENHREMSGLDDGKSSELKQLIVFQANKRVVSLYFPYKRNGGVISSSSRSQFRIDCHLVPLLFISYLVKIISTL